jgi:hypothetical protein
LIVEWLSTFNSIRLPTESHGQEGEAVKKLKNRDFCACKLLILKGPQNTKINFFTPSGGLPPLNVEFAQHYLQCKSVTSYILGEILSPPNAHNLEIL